MSTTSATPSPQNRPLRVFLCHSFSDKLFVRELYRHLRAGGFKPWLDEKDLIPGQKWQEEIPAAVRASDVVVVCLSQQSVTKEGYLQREIKLAIDAAKEKPERTIFIIPARIEEVDVPESLRQWQWVDFFSRPDGHRYEDGYEQLIRALNMRAKTIGATVLRPKEMFELGQQYYDVGNYDQAYDWFLQAAEAGHTGAMNLLGILYNNALGVHKDVKKAREWQEKAANGGDPSAMYNLGITYETARGVPKNIEKAREWYQKAAAHGFKEAKEKLSSWADPPSPDAALPSSRVRSDTQALPSKGASPAFKDSAANAAAITPEAAATSIPPAKPAAEKTVLSPSPLTENSSKRAGASGNKTTHVSTKNVVDDNHGAAQKKLIERSERRPDEPNEQSKIATPPDVQKETGLQNPDVPQRTAVQQRTDIKGQENSSGQLSPKSRNILWALIVLAAICFVTYRWIGPWYHVAFASSGEKLYELRFSEDVQKARFCPDSQCIVTAGGSIVQVWDRNGSSLGSLAHSGSVARLAFSPDSRRILLIDNLAFSAEVQVVDLARGGWFSSMSDTNLGDNRNFSGLLNATFLRDNQRIVTITRDASLKIWETTAQSFTTLNLGFTLDVTAFSADGQRLAAYQSSANGHGSVHIFNSTTGIELAILQMDRDIREIVFSPDSQRIMIIGSDNTVQVWNATSSGSKPLAELKHNAVVSTARFSLDGRRVVTACHDNVARVWNIDDGRSPLILPHGDMVLSAQFSPDGHYIVTASRDKSARVWDSLTGQSQITLKDGNDRSSVIYAEFSPNGQWILTLSAEDHVVRIWKAIQ